MYIAFRLRVGGVTTGESVFKKKIKRSRNLLFVTTVLVLMGSEVYSIVIFDVLKY